MPFYRRRADGYEPTRSCIGPWDARVQHGGPPAALLAGAAERFGESAEDFVVVRATVELLRPVGFLPLSVEVTPLRLGRRAQWIQADLIGDGRHLARATVVRVARSAAAPASVDASRVRAMVLRIIYSVSLRCPAIHVVFRKSRARALMRGCGDIMAVRGELLVAVSVAWVADLWRSAAAWPCSWLAVVSCWMRVRVLPRV